MGQISLEDLEALGDATCRAVAWLQSQFTPQKSDELGDFFEALIQSEDGNAFFAAAPPPPFVRGGATWSEGTREFGASICEAHEPDREDHTIWSIRLSVRQKKPRVDIVLDRWKDFELLRVIVENDRKVEDDILGGRGFVDLLKSPAIREVGGRASFKDMLQGLDALTQDYFVVINPSWSAAEMKSSVMAQLAEWIIRVGGHQTLMDHELSEDAALWWLEWAKKIAGPRRARDLSLAEVAEIAKRTVRPHRAAGHRLYWRMSLANVPTKLVDVAILQLGISRRTIFERMRKADVHLSDFADLPDPEAGFIEFLGGQEPTRLPSDRKGIVNALVEAGMKPNSARRIERRSRDLPKAEQAARLQKALLRATREMGGRAPEYSPRDMLGLWKSGSK